MLIKCPECQKEISDKSLKCTYCGLPSEYYAPQTLLSQNSKVLPLQATTSSSKTKKVVKTSNRRIKLPNGFGSIRKLAGKRRKPYASYPPVKEYRLTGSPILPKAIGYYETYNDAYLSLIEYNNNPFMPNDSRLTFAEAYKRYTETLAYQNLRDSSKESRESAFAHCEPLHDICVRDINKIMCQKILDDLERGSSTKKNVLTCMKTVSQVSRDLNLITKDFTDGLSIIVTDETSINREVFTKEEIDYLWTHNNEWDCAVLLILLYSGMRVNELLKNRKENVSIAERKIYVPKELAKNKDSVRDVPIHERIVPLVERFMSYSDSEMLMCNPSGVVIAYNNFTARNMKRINEALKTNHRCHDTRHTFATQCAKLQLDEISVQKIIGHAPDNMLRSTYIHLTNADLLKVLADFEYCI